MQRRKKRKNAHTQTSGWWGISFFFVGYNVNILEQNIHWVYYVNEACALFFVHGFWRCCAFIRAKIWSEKKGWCLLYLYATSIVFICYLLFRANFVPYIFRSLWIFCCRFSSFIQALALLFFLLLHIVRDFVHEVQRYNCIKRRQRRAK